MMSKSLFCFMILAAGQLVHARKFVIHNQCKAPVWAAYMGENAGQITVNDKAGMGSWKQATGQKDTLDVPEFFMSGKFWAATGCNDQGTGCKVGGCPNGKCDGQQVGQSGATLAEFSLGSGETFDISITDGFNVPIETTPTGGTDAQCQKVSCGAQTDLLTLCDPALAFPHGSDTVWACFNPCTAGIQFESNHILPFSAGTAPSCCPGNSKDSCSPDDVPFFKPLKAACQDGFVYPPETEMNHMCRGAEYLIEFCPGGKGIGANPSGNPPVDQCAGGAILGGGFTGTNSDGGGSFNGLPANAGQSCDGSSSSSSTSTGSGGSGGTNEEAGSGGSNEAVSSKSQSAPVASGTGTGSSDNTGSGSGSAGIGSGAGIVNTPSANEPAPAASNTPAAPVINTVPASNVNTLATAPAVPAASHGHCRGRQCRNGSGGGRGDTRRRKLDTALKDRSKGCSE